MFECPWRSYIRGLENITNIRKFIDRDSKIKLEHCLTVKHIYFCNKWLYELPKTDSNGLLLILNVVVRFNVNMPKYRIDRVTQKGIEIPFSPVKVET